MKNNSRPIDGFVARESRRSIGSAKKTSLSRPEIGRRQAVVSSTPPSAVANEVQPRRRVSRREIDDSLSQIDQEPERPKKRGIFRRKTAKPPASRRKKIIKRLILAFFLIMIVAIGYVGIRALMAGSSIFKGNIFDIVQSKPLKADENGRTNILVFGTSGSVDDQRHEGADLTDTLMVLSIDQNKKNAYMVSLPRDLYVDYGDTCFEGNRGKINSLYACYSDGDESEASDAEGAAALQQKVGEVVGLDLQYYAHINWAVVTGAINAIGGVDVNVEGNGSCAAFRMPEGSVVDINMDFRYTPGVHTMDGEEALKFSRARNSAGGCGLAAGDFDRQMNQQRVLKAMQEKAVSAETLTNLGKVTGLIDALGANLRTNFETAEIRTLMSLGNDIKTDKIQSIDLISDENTLITSGNIPGAGSTQVPTAGTYDYSEINAFINKTVNSNEVTREAANIAVFNGSGVTGLAQERADELEGRGYTISAVETAPEGTYKAVEIYDLTSSKPATKEKLANKYKVKIKTSGPPVEVTADTDFVIIFGSASAN